MAMQKDLIINYLPQMLTEDEFKSMFLSIGPIKSCKIVRDHATNYSYGFGFVEYYEPEHAAQAISTLNGFALQNKKIKVAYSRKGDDIKGTNLYIRGLPLDIRQDDLEKIFSKFGNIINCRVLIDQKTGQGRGVGFVLFSNKAEAHSAIRELNGTMPEGSTRKLSVQFAEEYTLKARPDGHYLPFNLPSASGQSYQPHGGNINRRYNNRSEYQLDCYSDFSVHPHYKPQHMYCDMPHRRQRNQYTSKPSYYNPASANNCNTATSAGPSGREYVLFVYNIGTHSDEVSLLQIFSSYGHISKVAVVKDPSTGKGKGYGFVTMPDFHEAQAAINALNGYKYMGRPLQVSFKN